MAGLNRRTINTLKFLVGAAGAVALPVAGFAYFTGETDPLRILGICFLTWFVATSAYELFRCYVLPPKDPKSYGDWCIITGSTSGIGAEFATQMAAKGLNLLLISRCEEKLAVQSDKLRRMFRVQIQTMTFDFKKVNEMDAFYQRLEGVLPTLEGGIGILINNVGIANEVPYDFEEMDKTWCKEIMDVNLYSQVFMTKAVMPFMKARKKGLILSVSSSSCTHATPMLTLYSATKSFMMQFSRSLAVELKEHGIDVQVLIPYYVVSNLFKSRQHTAVAPMTDIYVRSCMRQLGKDMPVFKGWWAHWVLGKMFIYGGKFGTQQMHRIMKRNRRRYEERKAKSKDE